MPDPNILTRIAELSGMPPGSFLNSEYIVVCLSRLLTVALEWSKERIVEEVTGVNLLSGFRV